MQFPSDAVSVYLFGPLRVQRNGYSCLLKYNRAKLLFACLALEPGFHTRDALADRLWPGASTQDGRERLKRMVYHLKDVLGDAVLLTDRQTIRLQTSPLLWVDAIQFKALTTAGFADSQPGDPMRATALARAVRLYRGPLLQGMTIPDAPDLERWLLAHADTLAQRKALALRRMAQGFGALGDYPNAIRHARHLVESTPAEEGAWRLLLRLLVDADEADEARLVLEQCRDTLKAEIDVEPSSATLAVVESAAKPPNTAKSTKTAMPAQRTPSPAQPVPRAGGPQRVTAVFCEATLTVQVDAHAAAAATCAALDAAAAACLRGGARVLRVPGGFFGYFSNRPVVNEHAARALTVALSLVSASADPAHGDSWPRLRLGMHTAFLAPNGNSDVLDPAGVVSRPAVGLASLARAGEIVVSPAMRALLEELDGIELRPIDPPHGAGGFGANGSMLAAYRVFASQAVGPGGMHGHAAPRLGGDPHAAADALLREGQTEAALASLVRASRRKAARYAHADTLALLEHALRVLALLPDSPERTVREVELRAATAMPLLGLHGYAAPAAADAVEMACRVAAPLGDDPRLFDVFWRMWMTQSALTNYHDREARARTLVRLAGQSPQLQLHAQFVLGSTLLCQGRLEPAIAALQRSVAATHTSDALSPIFHKDMRCVGLAWLSWAHWFGARFDESLTMSHASVACAHESGDPDSLSYAYSFAALLHHWRREPDEVERLAQAVIRTAAHQPGALWRAIGNTLLGMSALGRGDPEGIATMHAHMAQLGKVMGGAETKFFALLAATCQSAGQHHAGLDAARRGAAGASASGECLWLAGFQQIQGETLAAAACAPASEVQHWLCLSLATARGIQSPTLIIAAAASLVRHGRGAARTKGLAALRAALAGLSSGWELAQIVEARALLGQEAGPGKRQSN